MNPGKDDTIRLAGRKRRSNRRSSILKIRSPSRALSELDPNAPVDDDGTTNTKKLRRSRRVSFSATCQVKEFLKDVPWHAPPGQGAGPSAQGAPQGQPQPQSTPQPQPPQAQEPARDINLYIPPKTFPDGPIGSDQEASTRTLGGEGTQQKWEEQDGDKTKLFPNDGGDMELTTCITETITVDTTVSEVIRRPRTSRASLRGSSECEEGFDHNEYIDFTSIDDVFTETSGKNTDPANKLDTSSALSRIMCGKLSTVPSASLNVQSAGNKTVIDDADMDFTTCNTVDIEVLKSSAKVDTSTALSRIMSSKSTPSAVSSTSSADKTQLFSIGDGEMEMTTCIAQKISVGDLTFPEVVKPDNATLSNKTQIFDDCGDMDFTACHTGVIDTQGTSLSQKLDTGSALSRLMSLPKTDATKTQAKASMNQTVVDNADMEFTTCLSATINIPSVEDKIETSSALSRIMMSQQTSAPKELSSKVEEPPKLDSSSVLSRLSTYSSRSSTCLQNSQHEGKSSLTNDGNDQSDEPKVDAKSFLASLTGAKNPTSENMGNRTQVFTEDGDSGAMDFTACLTTNLKQDLATQDASNVTSKSMFDQTRVFENGEDLEFTTCLSKTQLQEFQNGKRDFEAKTPSVSATNGTRFDRTRLFSEGCDMDFTVCNDVTITVNDEEETVGLPGHGDNAKEELGQSVAQKSGFDYTKVFNTGEDMEMTTCLSGQPISSSDIATEIGGKEKATDRTRLYSQGSDDMEFTAQLTNVIVSGTALEEQQKENSSSYQEKLPRKTTAGLAVRADSPEISPLNVPTPKPKSAGLSDITHHYTASDPSANMDLTTCPEKTIHVRSSSTSDTDSDHDILQPDDGVPIRLGTITAPRMTKDGCIYTQATFDSTLKFIGDIDRSGRLENQSRLETVIETSRETSNASSVNESVPLHSVTHIEQARSYPGIGKSNEKQEKVAEDSNATRYYGCDVSARMDMTECVGGLVPLKTGQSTIRDPVNQILSTFGQNKTKIFGSENDSGAMEMTTCSGKILNQTNFLESTKIQPADMDMTNCTGGILEGTKLASDSNKTQILDGTTGAMEMTTCYGKILDTTKSQPAPNITHYFANTTKGEMELTTCAIPDSTTTKEQNKTHIYKNDDTAEMEMTTCYGEIEAKAPNKTRLFNNDETAAMEMTTCQGEIQENRMPAANKTRLFSSDETAAMEMTTCQGEIQENRMPAANKTRLFNSDETAAMEMTTCQGEIQENRMPAANKTRLFSSDETAAMEMTTCQGEIQENRMPAANKTRLFSSDETAAMEMTTCQGEIQENRMPAANKTRLFSNDETAAMEMTTCQGELQESITNVSNKTRLFDADETAAMEMTHCAGRILNRTRLSSVHKTMDLTNGSSEQEGQHNLSGTHDSSDKATGGEKTKIFNSDETAAMEMTSCTRAILDKTNLLDVHPGSKDFSFPVSGKPSENINSHKEKVALSTKKETPTDMNDIDVSLWDEECPDTEDLAPLHLSSPPQSITNSKSSDALDKAKSGHQNVSVLTSIATEANCRTVEPTSVNVAMVNPPNPEPHLELNVSEPRLKPVLSKPSAPVGMQPPWDMSVYSVPMLGTSSSQLSLVEISYFDDCQPQTIDDYLQLFNIPRETARRNSTVVRPQRMEQPTSAAESLSQSFLDVPMCDLLKQATDQLEQKKNRISESLKELEMDLMQNPPDIFKVIQKATTDERAAMKQKYRDLYKACCAKTAAARRSIKCDFVKTLNNKYQEQVEVAEKMKSELLDKIEFSAEVQNELNDVNATIQQDILALNGTECATPEQKAQLTSLDQRLEQLEKLCALREEHLKNVQRQITEASTKQRALEDQFTRRLMCLFPSGHQYRHKEHLKRIMDLCTSRTVQTTPDQHVTTFLFDSINLQITYGKNTESTSEQDGVTSLTLTSQLADGAADYAQLCHHFITSTIDQDSLQTTYPVKGDLQHIIHEVAVQVAIASDLAENVMDIRLLHKVKVEGFVISVEFSSLAAFAKFVLRLTIDPSSYPTKKPTWSLKSFIGSRRCEDIEEITQSVEPGLSYLYRLVSAVDNFLYSSAVSSS